MKTCDCCKWWNGLGERADLCAKNKVTHWSDFKDDSCCGISEDQFKRTITSEVWVGPKFGCIHHQPIGPLNGGEDYTGREL